MTTTPRRSSGVRKVLALRAAARADGPGRRARALLGAGALALLLPGCAIDTRVPDLHQDLPPAWRGAPPGGVAPAPDLDHWWRAFASAELDALMERALQQNLTIAQARERLRAARALEHRAGTEFLPQIGFSTRSITDPAGTTGFYEIGFDAVWESGFFGRGESTTRAAAGDRAAAEAELAAARVSVVAEVARAYVELRAAQARAAALDEIVALRRRRAELIATQERLKLAAAVDAARAQSELAAAEAEAGEAPAAAAAAENALAVLLAEVAPDAALAAPAPQPEAPAAPLAAVPADLLRTRPEIRRAESLVLRAAGELGIARADLYPKLALGGSLTSATRVTGDIEEPNKAIPILGPLVEMPIVDWGARRDLVDAREAALAAAVLGYRQAVLEGVAETESALAQLARQQRRVAATATALAASARTVAAAQALRASGLGDELELAAAELAAAQARIEHTLAVRDAALAFIALYKSLGGQMPTPTTAVR